MSGTATFEVVNISNEEFVLELLRSIRDKRNAVFQAIRLDDPSLTPEVHTFSATVETIHNGASSQEFDLIDTDHNWFRVKVCERKPIHFNLIL